MNEDKTKKGMNRRTFLRSSAAIGAGLAFSPMVYGRAGDAGSNDINVALLGAGQQGQTLMTACLNIKNPNIRFKAVCDIWEAYNQKLVSRRLNAFGHTNNAYADYKEMLDKEKDIDAVIIATPDFWHADHLIGALEAGHHVYCEKEMSNTIEGARKMLEAAKKHPEQLVQIGHQRRSNPRYIHCYENLIKNKIGGDSLLGQLTTVNGQWNRSKPSCEDQGVAIGLEVPADILTKFGFKTMKQFLNWRWYKGLGGGPIVDLGSHQIDIYSWFLGANPKTVMASGGIQYWKDHDWYDHVMAVFEYDSPDNGLVRAFYQTITTNSGNGYFEWFMGDKGSLVISEASARGIVYREDKWINEEYFDPWVKAGHLIKIEEEEEKVEEEENTAAMDPRETPIPPSYDLPVTMDLPYHQPHLQNFFDAIAGKAKLTCPIEVGYETAVTVLKVNEAVEAGKTLKYTAEEFKV